MSSRITAAVCDTVDSRNLQKKHNEGCFCSCPCPCCPCLYVIVLENNHFLVAQTSTDLKSGRYQLFNLVNRKIAYYKLPVNKQRVAPIDIQANPFRCDGPVNVYVQQQQQW